MNYHDRVTTVTGPFRGPQNHRTVDRVTQILEEVTYRPGITFAELTRALNAPKSSVHGFLRGLLAKGWLYESANRFYVGPAIFELTLTTGRMEAGPVRQEDLDELHVATRLAVALGVRAGGHLIYVSLAGIDAQTGFTARTSIRRELLATAGGKALLAETSIAERDSYLRCPGPEDSEAVSAFLAECPEIKRTRIATNTKNGGSQFAMATVVPNDAGKVASAVTIVGPAIDAAPREAELRETLLQWVDALPSRLPGR
jgi:DNA-binding IclR family transcriptional regulator